MGAAYMNAVGIKQVNLRDPMVISGLLIGAMLPYLFAAITMLSVGESAQDIMQDVRNQFADKKDLKADAVQLEKLREEYEELEKKGSTEEKKKVKDQMDDIYSKYFDGKDKTL